MPSISFGTNALGSFICALIGLLGDAWLVDGVRAGELFVVREKGYGLSASLSVSPDGKLLAAGYHASNRVDVFDAATGKKLFTLTKGGLGPTHAVAFSPDGKTLAVVDRWEQPNGKNQPDLILGVRLWDVQRRELTGEFGGLELRGSAIAYSPDGRLLAAGDVDGTVIVWNLDKRTQLWKLVKEVSCGSALAFSLDSSVLVFGGDSTEISAWDVKTQKRISEQRHKCQISRAVFSGEQEDVVSVDICGHVLVWNAKKGTIESERELTTKNIEVITKTAISRSGRLVAIGTRRDGIRLWDRVSGKELVSWNHSGPYEVTDLAFSPDGKRLYSIAHFSDPSKCESYNEIKAWETPNPQP